MLALFLSTLALGARELTDKDFDDVVFNSGKGAFVKFLAPWCGHCKSMKPAWDELAEKFKDSELVTIADVDCTAGGDAVCNKVGVQGYPTIKYWLEGEPKGKDYNGGRSLKDLEKFTAKTFQKPCDVGTQENCSEEQKTFLDSIKGKDAGKLHEEKTAKLKADKDNRAELEKNFKKENKERKKNEAALAKEIGLLNKVVKSKGGKDEL